ncbi:MAG: hypothetical protein ACTSYO_03310 [Candidatus Ranarchaeia archaeon]
MFDLLLRLIGLVLVVTSGYYIIFEGILIGDFAVVGTWMIGLLIGLLLLIQPWTLKKKKNRIGKVRLPPPEEL